MKTKSAATKIEAIRKMQLFTQSGKPVDFDLNGCHYAMGAVDIAVVQLVRTLQAVEFTTVCSCEGHIDAECTNRLPFPWVTIDDRQGSEKGRLKTMLEAFNEVSGTEWMLDTTTHSVPWFPTVQPLKGAKNLKELYTLQNSVMELTSFLYDTYYLSGIKARARK